MQLTPYQQLSLPQQQDLVRLWNRVYPAQLAYADQGEFEQYLASLEAVEHVLVEDESGAVKGWYFQFLREGRIWFAMLLDAEIQGQGIGSTLLNQAKAKERELNGWVVDHPRYHKHDGRPYRSPLAFYLKNGFEVLANDRFESETLSAVRIRWRRS